MTSHNDQKCINLVRKPHNGKKSVKSNKDILQENCAAEHIIFQKEISCKNCTAKRTKYQRKSHKKITQQTAKNLQGNIVGAKKHENSLGNHKKSIKARIA